MEGERAREQLTINLSKILYYIYLSEKDQDQDSLDHSRQTCLAFQSIVSKNAIEIKKNQKKFRILIEQTYLF